VTENAVKHHVTRDEDRLPVKTKLAYGMGGVANTLMANGVSSMANIVFNIGLGVNPMLVGLALSLPRIWEAMTDPFMGSISDNYRSRFGRRRPFIALGAILCGILFSAMWFIPHGWSEKSYFYHLMIASILFYTALTVFTIPYGAMGLEISNDYHERTRVQSYTNTVATLSGFAIAWIYALLKLNVFHDVVEAGKYVGMGLGAIMLLFGLIPAVFGRERYSVSVQHQEKIPIVKAMKESLKNKPFILLIFAVIFMTIGIFSIGTIGAYLNIYYVYGGNQKPASIMQGWGGTAYLLASLIAIPIISVLSAKYGKKNVLLGFLYLATVGAISKWWCYTPDHPFLQLIPNAMIGAGFSALWILISSMLADTCDYDEITSHLRREGIYGAMFGWVSKLGVSLAFFLSGVTLNITGFNVALGGHQSASTFFWMRILAAGVAAVASLVAALLIHKYPITEERAYEIRAELETRKAMLAEEDLVKITS